MAFAKSILDYVSFIIPFYEEATLGLVVWLGFFDGARIIYQTFLRPVLKAHEAEIDANLADATNIAREKVGELGAAAPGMLDAAAAAARKMQ